MKICKIISKIVLGALICGCVAMPLSENRIVKAEQSRVLVEVDGKKVDCDVAPFIQNGRTLVPFRAIFESLGAKVDYNFIDVEHKRVWAIKNTNKVELVINELEGKVNETIVKLDVAPIIKENRTFVPARFVSESLGAKVEWDGANRKVIIRTKDPKAKKVKKEDIVTDAKEMGDTGDAPFYEYDTNIVGAKLEMHNGVHCILLDEKEWSNCVVVVVDKDGKAYGCTTGRNVYIPCKTAENKDIVKLIVFKKDKFIIVPFNTHIGKY